MLDNNNYGHGDEPATLRYILKKDKNIRRRLKKSTNIPP